MTRAQAHDLVDTGLEDTGLHERHPVVAVESIPACTGDSAPPLLHAIPAKVYPLVHRGPLTSLGRRSLQRSITSPPWLSSPATPKTGETTSASTE